LILLVFSGTGAALWHGVGEGQATVFVFVVAGWVVSLCLHEFGHALVAYLGGDRAIANTGYLDLDPLRYSDPLFSIVLPVAYIVVGGFGLPGGAVYVNTGRLRNRAWKSFVAAAGPVMNLVFLVLLAALYALLPNAQSYIGAGLAVLALFQATAIVLNLLPFPGLDGFGIIRPFLPVDVAIRADQIGSGAFLLLFLLIWLTPVGGTLMRVGIDIAEAFGFDFSVIAAGFGMLKIL
jgi:Zn-dependent protease